MDIKSVWPACPSCRKQSPLTEDESREVAAILYRIERDFSSVVNEAPLKLEGRPVVSYLSEDEAEEIRTESMREYIRWHGLPVEGWIRMGGWIPLGYEPVDDVDGLYDVED